MAPQNIRHLYLLSDRLLGNLYYEGQGVPQDDEEALRWIELAAEQGNSLAQANLEKMQVR